MSVPLRSKAGDIGKSKGTRAALAAGMAVTTVLSGISAALAECVDRDPHARIFVGGDDSLCGGGGCQALGQNAIPAPIVFLSVLNALNTSFLTPNGSSAFVGAPGNPQPNQPSGGVWAKGVAGTVETSTNSVSTIGAGLGLTFGPGVQDCHRTDRQDYVGFQVGADLARLNIGNSGANWHFGVTAGNLSSKVRDASGSGGSFEVPDDLRTRMETPFVGLYTVFTQRNFFADVLVRWDFYQSKSSAPGIKGTPAFVEGAPTLDFSGVKNDARGFSVLANTGYQIPLMSGWFLEPSIGAAWSRVEVDPVTMLDSTGFGATVQTQDIESVLGRASLRIGANIALGEYTWQPFITASVFHEFQGKVNDSITFIDPKANVKGGLVFAPNIADHPGIPVDGLVIKRSTASIGTFGQIGLGTALVIGDTGWLGYGRADVKFGENIEGVNFNVGLRYQW